MSITRIGIRYAKPLLSLADDLKVLDDVKDDMTSFLAVCSSNKDFMVMLKSPIIKHTKKAAILKAIFEGKVNDLTTKFFDMVARKQREKFLPEIAKEFVNLYNEKLGLQEATVTTTLKLDASTRKVFEKLVADITGKKALLKERVEANLIGGYVLQFGDRQIDESASGHLRDLKLKFRKEKI